MEAPGSPPGSGSRPEGSESRGRRHPQTGGMKARGAGRHLEMGDSEWSERHGWSWGSVTVGEQEEEGRETTAARKVLGCVSVDFWVSWPGCSAWE